jgi:hypothetical protein
VLRGEGDVNEYKLDEDELQKAMRFCSAIFAPTSPEMHASVSGRLDSRLTDINGPVLLPEDIRRIVGADEDAFHVLTEINARKPIHTVYNVAHHFMNEAFAGLVPNIVRGELGLTAAV